MYIYPCNYQTYLLFCGALFLALQYLVKAIEKLSKMKKYGVSEFFYGRKESNVRLLRREIAEY